MENLCIGCVPPRRTATGRGTCPAYAAFYAENRERNRQWYLNKPPCSRTKEKALAMLDKKTLRGRPR